MLSFIFAADLPNLNITFTPFYLISLAYSIWLVYSGSPIFWQRARPTSTRPVILSDDWFRYSGGIYIAALFAGLLTGSTIIYLILRVVAGIAFLVGLWRSLTLRAL